MNMKAILLGILVGSLGALGLAVSEPAAAQSSSSSCVPYNSQWMLCTRTVFDPTRGGWVEETYFQRWPDQDQKPEDLFDN